MQTENKEISELKVGSYIIMDGAACRVAKMDHSAPGKHGHAKYRVEAIGLLDDKKRVTVLTSHDKVQVPIIEKRDAQVLSVSGENAEVMDLESYETFTLIVPEELKGQVAGGQKVIYWDVLGTKVIKQVKG